MGLVKQLIAPEKAWGADLPQSRFSTKHHLMKKLLLAFAASALGIASSLAATYTVTNTSNSTSVQGSLPWAVFQAQYNSVGSDTIEFNIPGGGPHTINLAGPLYLGAEDQSGIKIDATTQPGYAGSPLIYLNAGGNTTAINLIQSSGNAIRGLAIYNFANIAIAVLDSSHSNTIENNWIGFILQNGSFVTNSSLGYQLTIGIGITSHFNNVFSNVISGVDNAITVGTDPVANPATGLTAGANNFYYNILGGDPSGTVAIGNTSDGIFLGDGAGYNYVGYNNFGGQDSAGLELLAPLCFQNHVFGNYIGVGYTGAPLGNGEVGILLANGALYNYIGSYGGNYIGYNGLGGIALGLAAEYTAPGTIQPTYSNYVIYNYVIGNGSPNTSANQSLGISLAGYSMNNVIQENSVNGQAQHGIILGTVFSNYVLTNYLGTSYGNNGFGIFLQYSQYNVMSGNVFGYNALGTFGLQDSPNNYFY